MSDTPSAATAEVVEALARWQAETSASRYPQLVVTEVLDRVGSDHAYLSVVFAHGSDRYGWDVKPIADLFLKWLRKERPEFGGPHLAFLKARPDLVPTASTQPPEPEAEPEDLLRHATAFAAELLGRIPATHNLYIPDGDSDDWVLDDCVYVFERDAPDAELRLSADTIVDIIKRRYEEAHPDWSWRILWMDARERADISPPEPESDRRDVVVQASFFPAEAQGLAPDASPSQRHAHVRDFAQAWLDLIPFTHAIYVAEPWEEDLGDPVTVRIYRDDDYAEHKLHEDEAAGAIERRYGERYPEEAASIAWLADYCK